MNEFLRLSIVCLFNCPISTPGCGNLGLAFWFLRVAGEVFKWLNGRDKFVKGAEGIKIDGSLIGYVCGYYGEVAVVSRKPGPPSVWWWMAKVGGHLSRSLCHTHTCCQTPRPRCRVQTTKLMCDSQSFQVHSKMTNNDQVFWTYTLRFWACWM